MHLERKEGPNFIGFASIAGWWALLFVFASAGRGHLGILWILISSLYFVFHPHQVVQKGATLDWGVHTAVYLIEIIASTILLSYIFTCLAWTVGLRDGAYDNPTPLFYLVGIAFLVMGAVSLTGLSTNLLLASSSHSTYLHHVYCASVVAGYFVITYFFRGWMFSSALDIVGHKAHVYVAAATLVAYLAHYLFWMRKGFVAPSKQ